MCTYMKSGGHTPSSPALTPLSLVTPPPFPPPPKGAGEVQTPTKGDNKEYVAYLQSRIATLENYHRLKDEEDKVRELEARMRDLEISAQRRGAVAPGQQTAARPASQPAASSFGPVTGAAGGGGQPPFPKADQAESPIFNTDEHGRVKRSCSKFRPDFHMDLGKSIDKFTFREYMLGCPWSLKPWSLTAARSPDIFHICAL